MIYDKKITQDLVERFKKNNGVLSLWKLYDKNDRGIKSPFFSHGKSGKITRPGIYESSKKNLRHTCKNVEKGFHVFIDRKEIGEWENNECGSTVIIKVKVKLDDLVAGGWWEWSKFIKTAVFRKIEITKEEWSKIKF
jgi:hypothetical protein